MQVQTNVFPVQTQVVGQTRVVPVQTVTTTQQGNAPRRAGMEVFEVIFRGICTAFSLGVLISAAVAVSAINEVEDFFGPAASDFYGFDADSYRGAAGWLIFVASTALLYHIAMIIVRCLYIKSVIEKHLTVYGVINIIVIILFGLSFLSGGIPNVVFAADNGSLHTDLCFFGSSDAEFCSALQRVVASEAASGALSLIALMLHVMVFCTIVCFALEQSSQSTTYSTQPHFAASHQPAQAFPPTSQYVPPPQPAYPATNPSQYTSPSAPYYPPVSVPPSAPVQPPANASSYASDQPPPYESAVTSQYKSHVPSGDPPNES